MLLHRLPVEKHRSNSKQILNTRTLDFFFFYKQLTKFNDMYCITYMSDLAVCNLKVFLLTATSIFKKNSKYSECSII